MPKSSTKETGLEVVEIPVVENTVNFEDKYEDIKKAAYEINSVIRLDPPICIEGDPALLIKDFAEAIKFVSKFDKISEDTMNTIELFKKHSKNVEYYTKLVNKKYNNIKKNYTKAEVKRLIDLINQFYVPPTPIEFRESFPIEYGLNELMINLKYVTRYIKFDKRSLSLLKALGKTFTKGERLKYKKEINKLKHKKEGQHKYGEINIPTFEKFPTAYNMSAYRNKKNNFFQMHLKGGIDPSMFIKTGKRKKSIKKNIYYAIGRLARELYNKGKLNEFNLYNAIRSHTCVSEQKKYQLFKASFVLLWGFGLFRQMQENTEREKNKIIKAIENAKATGSLTDQATIEDIEKSLKEIKGVTGYGV